MPANNHSAAVQPSLVVVGTPNTANTACVCTAAAPGANYKWVITGFEHSASAAPAAAAAPTLALTMSGVAQTVTYGVPASAYALTGRNFPDGGLDTDPNTAVVFTLPALGAGVIGYASLTLRKVAVA